MRKRKRESTEAAGLITWGGLQPAAISRRQGKRAPSVIELRNKTDLAVVIVRGVLGLIEQETRSIIQYVRGGVCICVDVDAIFLMLKTHNRTLLTQHDELTTIMADTELHLHSQEAGGAFDRAEEVMGIVSLVLVIMSTILDNPDDAHIFSPLGNSLFKGTEDYKLLELEQVCDDGIQDMKGLGQLEEGSLPTL